MISPKKAVSTSLSPLACLSILISASVLTACGGDSPQVSNAVVALPPAEVATGMTTLDVTLPVLPPDVAIQMTQPTFHIAPVLLDAPADTDAFNGSRSAHMPPALQTIPREWQGVHGRGLTVSAIRSLPRPQLTPPPIAAGSIDVLPSASTGVVSTYTPAQIRAAYGLPTLPASMTGLTAVQAAQLGAGQTIYIVNARHDPNIVAELNAFNQKFGLPACAAKTIASSTALPLAAASASACEFAVVFSTSAGGMSSNAPAYDSGWATEIALDVQWAHATAPLARIILIEAADSSMSNMVGGIKLANAMGPGVVSMSFGSTEGSWTAGVESTFSPTKMTYLAASGDNGPDVEWPAVSPNVVAVGGTSLTYSGGSRTEVAWSNTGGGVSAYTATPSYQNTSVPGMGAPARRTVADVSMNSDPNTGQYVAVMTQGSSTVNWVSAGGTSLATPQWAGIIAVANATLVQTGKTVLGAPHAVLYNKIASVPGSYANVFADVAKGSNGSCASCTAKIGHDQLTGLGTPNVSNLLSTLSGTVITPAPAVTSASISGQTGTALSFTVSATASNALTYSLSGNPSGMTISSAGIVTWATPVAGTYAVIVTVLDAATGQSGKGTYTVTITAPVPPLVTASTINGVAGSALSFNVNASSANALTYTLSGAPSGMSINQTGAVNWASPLAGKYVITVVVKDGKTGLSSQAIFNISIVASGLSINAPALTGVAGKALTGTISITAPGATSLSISISGAPLGLNFSMSGTNIITSWSSPVTGSYTLKVTATDNTGRTATTNIPLTITAK
ncbi:putative Ig domain-containing protein [Undibacterium sp. Ji42W]|uniref:putative Ig domain-containing protein n=1 Tax=Undibacterium sp. Ji42W TaxID=3413039 RepID=UPI003BF0BBA2